MISSMTGFGRGQASGIDHLAVVEIKTVNSRFCEVSIRAPRELTEREPALQRIVKSELSRGRVTLNVQLDRSSTTLGQLTVDEEAARTYRELLSRVARAAALPDEPVTLTHLMQFQDILVAEQEVAQDSEALWETVREALDQALVGLRQMRLTEGGALEKELTQRAQGIARRLVEVRELAPKRIPAARARLRDRLADLIKEGRLDPDRIEQEMALTADRLDITEECVRLDAHLEAFSDALGSDGPVGRKLNFLSQEINREVNTIGSKANDAQIAQIVIGMKEDLEKIREQIENVE
jgi:uncharacterized protein (TIGR00255 family)